MGEKTSTNCIHHWKIAEPAGITSSGRCQLCGTEKVFTNWIVGMDFLTNEEQRALRMVTA